MRSPAPAAVMTLLASALLEPAAPRPQDTPQRIGAAEQVRVSLVVIDAVVRDRKDAPVRGLTRDDFILSVDGVPAPPGAIETFEEVCGPIPVAVAGGPSPSSPAQADPADPGLPRHIVVFADFAQMSLTGRNLALRAMQEAFAGELAPTERVMILAHRKGLRLVQDFTSDASLLRARFAELYAERATIDSDVLDEPGNISSLFSRIEPGLRFPTMNLRGVASAYMQAEANRARQSLRYLTEIMPALAALKGRKALILLSDVLREEPGVAYASLVQTTPEAEGINLRGDLLRLGREANAAGISIYTVHASGLEDPGADASMFGAAQPQALVGAARTNLSSALGLQTTLAEETGGRALQRTNEVAAILRTARQDLACHYLLGYRANLIGDGRRHDIVLKVGPDPQGRPRRGLTVRHRPYYTDISPAERTDRALRSAMEIPALFTGIPIEIQAFPLGPQGGGRRLLIVVSLPMEKLSVLPAGPTAGAGRIDVRGEVSGGSDGARCPIGQEVPFSFERPAGGGPAATAPVRLVYETGCVIRPGDYELAVAVQDASSALLGGQRVPLRVPKGPDDSALQITDILLWSHDPAALVIASGAEPIGFPAGPVQNALLPLAQRVLEPGQEAMLTFLACPPGGESPSEAEPLKVRRQLLGEGGAPVADFRALEIADPPDPQTGCYPIVSAIPSGSLGLGIYTFQIRAIGPPVGSPAIERSVEIAVR